jgi:DmsE family decaheme c-type cytochrome
MKLLRRIMLLCAFVAGMGTAATLFAAEDKPAVENQQATAAQPPAVNKLPDLSMEGVKPKSAQESLKKDAICTRCHDESEQTPILSLYQTKHGVRGDSRTPNCQSCHGESEKHLHGDASVKGRAAPDIIFKKGTFAVSDSNARSGQCLTCHKGNNRTNWDGSQHQNGNLACNDCHKVHTLDKVRDKRTQTEVCFTCHKEQRADTHKLSTHPIDAGKMGCSDCHNPHGSTGPKLLVKNNVNETCYTCHAEKRGPFLWEHGPVMDDCANCHTPHGSVKESLLKTSVPYLCQECHSGDHGNGINSASNLMGGNALGITVNGVNLNNTAVAQNSRAQLGGRACLNCHILIHGSNSPAGAKFQR